DTLLQGFLGASMQVQATANHLPQDSLVKASLHRAVGMMRSVIEEGRRVVDGLRSSQSFLTELEETFSRIEEEMLPFSQSSERPRFRVFSEGLQKPVHPVIAEEVYRIAREALINAFRHANARNIEMELTYSSASLRVVVRDDGCGIDPQVLDAG